MSQLRKLGPEKPRPLMTVRRARIEGCYLWIYCARCDRGGKVEGVGLPDTLSPDLTVGELWLKEAKRPK